MEKEDFDFGEQGKMLKYFRGTREQVPHPPQYNCASLVKIHPFIQQTACRQAIIQQSKPSCDLENGVKVTKIKLVNFHATTIWLCKFS